MKKGATEYISGQIAAHVSFIDSLSKKDGAFHSIYYRGNRFLARNYNEMFFEIIKDRNRRSKNIVKFLTSLQQTNGGAKPKLPKR